MTLPPWLWRILRSRKTRRAGIVLLCLLLAAVAGFYPVVNWWGAWACRKAEAEIRSRGYLVPDGMMPTLNLEGSFYFHEIFASEADRPEAERLFGYDSYMIGQPRTYPEWSVQMAAGKLTRVEAEAARNSLAAVETRRSELLAAFRQSSRLSELPGNDWISLPPGMPQRAYDMACFLGEHAILTSLCGDRDAALDEFETALDLLTELRDPRLGPRSMNYYPYDRVADEIGRLSRAFVAGVEAPEWSEPQLARLERMLAGFDFPGERSGLLERLPGCYLATHHEIQAGRLPGPPNISAWMKHWDWRPLHVVDKLLKSGRYFKPRGMYELERAQAMREITTAVEEAKTRLPDLKMEPIFVSARKFNDASAGYAICGDIDERLYYSESLQLEILQQPLSLVRHVIALERHRLRHGEYPRTLGALDSDLGKSLPMDPLSGRPPEYDVEKAARSRFKLVFAEAGPNRGVERWKHVEVEPYQSPWR